MLETALSLPVLALVLGLMHAFEADHVAAVSTLATRATSARHSSLLGALWGLGHTTTLFVVGIILLGFRLTIPESLALTFEHIVALALVALGLHALWSVRRDKLHIHTHEHGGEQHVHVHSHKFSPFHKHTHTSFAVGLLHGLAGSGALALLALTTSSNLRTGALFMFIFGIGSTAGMAILSGSIGFLLQHTTKFAWLRSGLRITSGILSIVVALTILPTVAFFHALVW